MIPEIRIGRTSRKPIKPISGEPKTAADTKRAIRNTKETRTCPVNAENASESRRLASVCGTGVFNGRCFIINEQV